MQKHFNKILKKPVFLVFLSVFIFVLVSHQFYFLIYFAFIPLFLAIYQKSLREATLYSLLFSILMLVFFFDWMIGWALAYRIFYYFIFTLIFMSFFLVFLLITNLLSKKTNLLFFVFIVPFVWLLLRKTYSFFGIGVWIEPSAFSPVLAPITWFIGATGISFLIILFNVCIAALCLKRNKKLTFLLSLLIIILSFSYLYSYTQSDSGENIKVALLQGNFQEPWGWRVNNVEKILSVYENLTSQAAKSKPDIIVWPEYSIIADVNYDRKIYSKISNIAKRANTTIIFGSIKYVRNFTKYTNTAYIFSKTGNLVDHYDSVEPFIFDEYAVKSREKANMFNISRREFMIIACNEETMPKLSDLYNNRNEEFIVSIANNQGTGKGIDFLSLYTRLRAAENRKYIARATNTGITQIIDSYGKVTKIIKPEKRNILIGEVYLNRYKTVYSKYGDAPLFVLIIILLIFLKKR